jgi:hypothetical protein
VVDEIATNLMPSQTEHFCGWRGRIACARDLRHAGCPGLKTQGGTCTSQAGALRKKQIRSILLRFLLGGGFCVLCTSASEM